MVTEVGDDVEGFRAGDRVGVGTYVNSCKECSFCSDHLENHCLRGCVHTFNNVDADSTITKGGYSSFIVVHHRSANHQKFEKIRLISREIAFLSKLVRKKMTAWPKCP